MPEDLKSYDLIVLGGGPAGIVGADTAAAYGKSIALVDNHPELGGAGINTGTVPSKTLRETALTLSGARSRNLYGVDLSLRRDATVADFLGHERAVKASFNGILTKRLSDSHADVYQGTASFEDAHTLRIAGSDGGTTRIRGEYILIATGSSPVRPSNFPFGSHGIYDSDTILELDWLPKTMAVVGAGTIGSEYACIFAALHTEVHVIDGRKVLLPFLDTEVSNTLLAAMERDGVIFHWGQQVECCTVGTPEGVSVKLASGETLKVDALLVAAGRQSNTGQLNLVAAGIAPGERGLIPVDEHYQTKTPHIYAAGDVIGAPALASTSMEQARRAMRHAFGPDGAADAYASLLPTGVYTIPEASMIGETEESLKKKGVDYVVGRAAYERNARGKIIGADGFLKLLFSRYEKKLLGVHAIGEQATELIHVGLIAMLSDSTIHIFDAACFNIPTLGQLYKTAALDALSKYHAL